MNFREHFWEAVLKDNTTDPESFHDWPRDFYSQIDELKSSEEINLWIGSALSDQLVLVFLVYLLDLFSIDMEKLSVFQFIHTKDKNHIIRGLGELRPEQIKEYSNSFQLRDSQVSRCLDVWSAFTSETQMNI